MNHELEKPINIMIVGDTFVGKSALVSSYAHNSFPSEYTPTVFEQYSAEVTKR
jgi:small GTP-binding protein